MKFNKLTDKNFNLRIEIIKTMLASNPSFVMYAVAFLVDEGEDDTRLLRDKETLVLPEGFAIFISDIFIDDGDNVEIILTQYGEEKDKQIVNESSAVLQSNNLEMVLKLPKKLNVNANPIIREVVRNYLINAIKYGKTGKKITIEAKQDKSSTKLYVDDYGESLSEDDFIRIFDRGFQLSKKIVRGSGLGLAIVKRIAEAHGGTARGEPIIPKGNRFILELPNN